MEVDGRIGQFFIDGKWYIPTMGCDTMQLILDDLFPEGK